MMMPNNQLTSLLNSLLAIYPPEGVLLVGAGNGSGLLVEFLVQNKTDCVTLIEPQDAPFRQLEALVANIPFASKSWVLSKEVVAKESGHIDFYYANKTTESGLVNPEKLRQIWPNLRLDQKVSQQAISFGELCSQSNQPPNWLMIDCLGALQVINHDSHLTNFDVIVVNVLFDLNENAEIDAGYAEICNVLTAHSFKEKLKYAGQHPNVGHVVFVRDYKSQSIAIMQKLDTLSTTYEQAKAQHQAEQAALQQAKQTNDAQAKQQAEASAQLQAKIQQLQQQLDTLSTTYEEAKAQYQAEQTAKKITSGDADIDDFIHDIAPYFYGRSLTYVDVGACFGDVFLKFNNTKEVRIREAHLYEPNPDSFVKLCDNIKGIKKTSSLHAYNIGVADTEKTLKMGKAGTMTKVVSNQVGTESATGMFEVNAFSLDELSNSITDRRIHLLKIDVEGYEMAVLKGAKQLLKDQRIDVIYIEVGFNIKGTQQVYFGEVDLLMQRYNYRCFKIYEQRNEWMQNTPLLRRCNFAYMSANFAISNPHDLLNELYQLKTRL